MPIALWTKFAAIALVAGTAFAWSAGPSAAQLFPSRTAVIDGQAQQVEQAGYRRHVREHRRWHRHHRPRYVHRHYRPRYVHHYRHHDRYVSFGIVVPYVAAPPIAYAAPPVIAPGYCDSAVIVRYGDTLAGIAVRCGTSVAALLRANPQIWNPHLIAAGQVIRMPWA